MSADNWYHRLESGHVLNGSNYFGWRIKSISIYLCSLDLIIWIQSIIERDYDNYLFILTFELSTETSLARQYPYNWHLEWKMNYLRVRKEATGF